LSSIARLQDPLKTLRDRVPRLVEALDVSPDVELASWRNVLDTKLLPRVSPDSPLMVAICGGGSTGKSTLFNSLARENLSAVGGKAGLNRRVLVGAHPELLKRDELLTQFFEPFGQSPAPLKSAEQLTEPGAPLYVPCHALPPGIVLMDTPDFDTGLDDQYTNREVGRPVLETCDLLLYIFTNATYNNLANTQFIRGILTDIGERKCLLVYRAYESFTSEQIEEHATTVASNLYGDAWRESILGIYRTDDTNEVASGDRFMELEPVMDSPPVLELLDNLDAPTLRAEQIDLMLRDVLAQAESTLDQCLAAQGELMLYRDAIRIAQSHCVYRALGSLPVHEVGARLQRLWEETGPPALRFMRRTSRALGYPIKSTFRLAKWVKRRIADEPDEPPPEDPLDARLQELEEAAGELHRTLLTDQVVSSTTDADPDGAALFQRIDEVRKRKGFEARELPFTEPAGRPGSFSFTVAAPAAIQQAREEALGKSWEQELAVIEPEARALLHVPTEPTTATDLEFDRELRAVIADFREQMSLGQRLRETAFASLHLVPPVVAVTYIISTGDLSGGAAVAGTEGAKVGVAATVYAKVKGLFGLNDLWALVALPANTGLTEADGAQLKQMLEPVIQRWFRNRSTMIAELFEERITRPIYEAASTHVSVAEGIAKEVEEAIARIRAEGLEHA